jgi:hypothetical protein
MSDHKSIYMVESASKPGEYRKTSRSWANRPAYVFEGVDGDEDANTVTYWYRRATPDERAERGYLVPR